MSDNQPPQRPFKPSVERSADRTLNFATTPEELRRARAYAAKMEHIKRNMPFYKRQGFKNAMVIVPLGLFCLAVAKHAGESVSGDFTRDPMYKEVLAEIKHEEIMEQTKNLDLKLKARQHQQ